MSAMDFFSQDRKSIEKLLILIQTRHNEASFAVDNQICALEEVTAEWKDFMAKCEQQNIWLKEMQTATNTTGFDRPLASDVDRQLDKCKVLFKLFITSKMYFMTEKYFLVVPPENQNAVGNRSNREAGNNSGKTTNFV